MNLASIFNSIFSDRDPFRLPLVAFSPNNQKSKKENLWSATFFAYRATLYAMHRGRGAFYIR